MQGSLPITHIFWYSSRANAVPKLSYWGTEIILSIFPRGTASLCQWLSYILSFLIPIHLADTADLHNIAYQNPLNLLYWGAYTSTNSVSPADPQQPQPAPPNSLQTLREVPSPHWMPWRKCNQPLQAFKMMTPGSRCGSGKRSLPGWELCDIIRIWSRTIRHLLCLAVQSCSSCCPNPQAATWAAWITCFKHCSLECLEKA